MTAAVSQSTTKYFINNPKAVRLEWNAASAFDWHKIERLLIAAYTSSYEHSSLKALALNEACIQAAKATWQKMYERGKAHGFEACKKRLLAFLGPSFSQRDSPLEEELNTLKAEFHSGASEISEQFIKLIALHHYFKEELESEKEKITSQDLTQPQRIHYLVARCHEEPVAFISCESNYKSARTYLRWVTISPSMHRQGLGKIMMDAIEMKFPTNRGLELYTRTENKAAQAFYSHVGFLPIMHFDFDEPDPKTDTKKPKGYFKKFVIASLEGKALQPPKDDGFSDHKAFIGFIRSRRVLVHDD